MRRFVWALLIPVCLWGLRYHAACRRSYDELWRNIPQHPLSLRRKEAIRALRSLHEVSQAPVLALLDSLKKEGLVRWRKGMWLADVVVFEGAPRAAKILGQAFPDLIVRRDAFGVAALSSPGAAAPATANLPEATAWNIELLGIPSVWRTFGAYGDGVIVAIFDSGLSRCVADVASRVWINEREEPVPNDVDDDGNGYIDDIWGYNFHDTTSHPYDDKGHGTHVCGTILGVNGTGVAPGVRGMSLKVIDHNGAGYESDVWLAFEYAIAMGAQVANLSIGWRYSEEPDRPTWRTVVQNAIESGLVVVVAAGNEGAGDPPNNLRTPGDIPEVITVGAVDSTLERAPFSSVGPVEWDDYPYPPGLIKPDVVAPGVDVPSTVLPGGYERWDGTSMATPHVAGLCALMRQINSELTHYQIKAILESTAVDLGEPGKDNEYGSGLVDPFAAVTEAADMCTLSFSAPVAGTLWVLPQMLRFTGEAGTAVVPVDADDIVFSAAGFLPETLGFACGDATFDPTPAPVRAVRIGVMDFESGDPISAQIALGNDTLLVDGFGWAYLPQTACSAYATAPGYTLEGKAISPEEGCVFFFLHRCIDFEDSAGFWCSGGWEWGEPSTGPLRARSGTRLWATALADTYSSSSDSWLVSEWLPAESTAAIFLWQWFDCEATYWGFWDGGNVLADLGDGWRVIYPIGDYCCWLDDYNEIMGWQPAFSGTLTGNFWHQRVFPLDVAEAGSVRIALHFSSDDNTTRAGWYVDDICVARRTVREPIVRSVEVVDANVTAAVYGVSSPLEEVLVVTSDSSAYPMLQVACDTFTTTLPGLPGDTVCFRVKAFDAALATAVFPPDSEICAAIPGDKVSSAPPREDGGIRFIHVGEELVLEASGCLVEVVDAAGRIVKSLEVPQNEAFRWRPERNGVYFVCAEGSSGRSVLKVVVVR